MYSEAIAHPSYSEDAPAKWMTESEKLDLIRARTKFMDITDHSTSRVVSLANWTPCT
jgi:hypothetical protein